MADLSLRSSQIVTTFGPGVMIDFPEESIILGGLEGWKYEYGSIPTIQEPRLLAALKRQLPAMGLTSFRSPPREVDNKNMRDGDFEPHVQSWSFPEWFVVQRSTPTDGGGKKRQLVHKSQLEKGKFPDALGTHRIVPVRFVRACNRGHVDDIDWRYFVHETKEPPCYRQMWITEIGTSGTLVDTWIICDCGKERSMASAARDKMHSLGKCTRRRPWLGPASHERDCPEWAKLLIRSASNAYFPQKMSVISIPSAFGKVDRVVALIWEKGLKLSQQGMALDGLRTIPEIGEALKEFANPVVEQAIKTYLGGAKHDEDRSVKEVEYEALATVVDEAGHDIPDGDFYARKMQDKGWRLGKPWMNVFSDIILVHRLREVVAQFGFTRFESVSPELNGEFDLPVKAAMLSRSEQWLPAAENRGEGIFLSFDDSAVMKWAGKPEVLEVAQTLADGFASKFPPESGKKFHGAPFYMIHSFSHLLMTQISLECGYPSSSLRERIYADGDKFGILIYTGSSDAEGTLGGLIQAGRGISDIIRRALISAELCSNDPVCAHEKPNRDTQRELLGSACHGCLLTAETSCEWANSFLERRLVVRTMANSEAEFFSGYGL